MTLKYGTGTFTAAVAAAALRAETDQKVGWHKSLSNIPVSGPT